MPHKDPRHTDDTVRIHLGLYGQAHTDFGDEFNISAFCAMVYDCFACPPPDAGVSGLLKGKAEKRRLATN